MRLIIAGGRDFNDRELLFDVLNKVILNRSISEVVSGKAKGADTLGEEWAQMNSIKVSEFPANWELYGKGAGHKRNKEMGNYADILVAFWDGESKGTGGMIKYMKSLNKPVIVELYNQSDLDEW